MAPTQKPMVILGAGQHARVVADLLGALNLDVAGFVAPNAAGSHVGGHPVLGDESLLEDQAFINGHGFAIGIGHQAARRNKLSMLMGAGADLPSLIHPTAWIGGEVTIGAGTVVLPGAIVCNAAKIGAGAIINTGAQIDHDGRLDDGVHLCPGTILAGDVSIGAWTFIGTGTVVSNALRIGTSCLVGAGSVVVSDIESGHKAFGNPCRMQGQIGPEEF